MDVKLRTYARLLEHGTISLEQIPDDYKDLVLSYDPDQDRPIPPDPEPEIFGAPTLESLHRQYMGNTMDVFLTELFTDEVLDGNPMPDNLDYSILRVENIYGRFLDEVSVKVEKTNYGFMLNIEGTPLDTIEHQNILRVDLVITSSNYENMTLTVYIVS